MIVHLTLQLQHLLIQHLELKLRLLVVFRVGLSGLLQLGLVLQLVDLNMMKFWLLVGSCCDLLALNNFMLLRFLLLVKNARRSRVPLLNL